MALLTWSGVIVSWIFVSCSVSFALIPTKHETVVDILTANPIVTSIIFFNSINLFVAMCEIILGYHIMYIKKDYQDRLKKYGKGKEWDSAFDVLSMPLTLAEVFHGKTWALMWSTYSLFDPSYQNHESFGFFIDVGNGWSTIPPSLYLNYAICYPEKVSPLILGCVVIASYWQMLYGTVIYFLSFFFNKRYEGRSNVVSILIFVVIVNGIWFFFPSVAIYAAYCILRDGNLGILQV